MSYCCLIFKLRESAREIGVRLRAPEKRSKPKRAVCVHIAASIFVIQRRPFLKPYAIKAKGEATNCAWSFLLGGLVSELLDR